MKRPDGKMDRHHIPTMFLILYISCKEKHIHVKLSSGLSFEDDQNLWEFRLAE
jgi:hypothetical protein